MVISSLMGCNEEALPVPTADLVRTACREFDQENQLVEEALGELFRQYPSNNNLPHVLLKVVALNGLYAAQILAVEEVARHIHRQAPEIDAALHAGSLVIVDKIAKVAIKGKLRNNYSLPRSTVVGIVQSHIQFGTREWIDACGVSNSSIILRRH